MYPNSNKLREFVFTLIPAVLALTAFRFIALRLHGGFISTILVGFGSMALVYLLYRERTRCTYLITKNKRSLVFSGLIVVGFSLIMVIVYWSGYILPAHDPIAVPLLAKTIASGHLPIDVFPVGSSAFAYPPGYPILFSPLMKYVPAVDAYFIFKIVNVATIIFIPASWAWMQRRLFPIEISSWKILLAAYLVFFGIERTIGFSLIFAGKNAVLLGILLSPIIVVLAVQQARLKKGWVLAVFPFFGLILIHYTMLHLLACLLSTYAVIGYITKRFTLMDCVRLGLIGMLAAGLLLLFMHEALVDPRSGSFTFTPIQSLPKIWDALVARRSFMVIYADDNFGIFGFPYRGLTLVLCTGISIAISYFTRTASIRYGAVLYFGAFVASLGMTFGVVPSGLAEDFARWFMWVLQAAILFQAVVALIWVSQTCKGKVKYLSNAGIAVGAIGAFCMISLDARVYTSINESAQVSRAELLNMQTILINASAGGGCFIIGDSMRLPDGLATVQSEKVWEYAESATSCVFVNGSWMQPGQVGGRSLDGLPSAKNIQAMINEGTLIFLGSEQSLNAYTELLSASGVGLKWIRVGSLDSLHAWKNVN